MHKEQRQRAFEAVERATELPMLVLALAMIPLIVVPLVMDLSSSADQALFAANWFIWAAFAAELVAKTYLAPDRRRYLITHWFDVLIVVIPFLRPLRIVRSLQALRLLQTVRLVAVLSRSLGSTRRLMTQHGLQYMLLSALVFVIGSAGAVALLERSAEGEIGGFDNALWWAIVTVTTVGYGDTVPTTTEARAIAAMLMLVGVGLFGVLTANIAAFFVESHEEDVSGPELESLRAQLTRIEHQLANLNRTMPANTVTGGQEEQSVDS